MSSRWVRVAGVVVALVAAALCRPSAQVEPRTVDLAAAASRSVCPVHVDVDEDEQRVPRRIKMIRCAARPNQWCVQQRIPDHECCEHSHNGHLMECVEIHDTVLVHYRDTNRTTTYDVAVGCTCMIERSAQPLEVPASSR